MIHLDIPHSLKVFCWDILKNHDLGERHSFNGNNEQQLVGLIGEYMTALALNLPVEFIEGFDGGYDLLYNGYKIDVKTMSRTVTPKSHYVCNFVGYQKRFKCDILMFASVNKKKNLYTLCGYLLKDEFLEKASFFPEGSKRKRDDGSFMDVKAPLYEIPISELRSVQTNKITDPSQSQFVKEQLHSSK